ncbi:uncharacterized protein LOC112560341 isoform X3 [Pomacea canaliculata]|uniref:uncharacterized protein LOC112560341 isoform X3 n=1 Tax=Pomacea canaliculata TaxID=400727 RepID=UPI000D73B105|nr:uncharacterized protein LOC112560341 isoform X3 [Pomacea canaliculata]
MRVAKEGENMNRVDIKLKGQRSETISLGLLSEDANNFAGMVAGYYHIFVDPDRRLVERTMGKNTSDPEVPSYDSVHKVQAEPWSYPEDLVSELVGTSGTKVSENERLVDLAHEPPEYVANEEYLSRIKEDLGIATSETTTNGDDNVSILNKMETYAMSAINNRLKRNGMDAPFEEGVTSFGTASSSSLKAVPTPHSSISSHPAFSPNIELWKVDSAAANGHSVPTGFTGSMQDPRMDSERSSDTDSISLMDAEHKPLLSQVEHVNGNLRNSIDAESDDTDSFGTPSGSPAKGRHLQRASSVESGMHSFGLHSPDTLPAADVDFQQMGDGDSQTLPTELYDAAYNTANILPSQKFYFDPDIIDLTVLPLLDVPDDDFMIDFTALPNLLPPTFSASPSPPVLTPENSTSSLPAGFKDSTLQQMHHIESSAGSDIFGSDIDTLIAHFYVPPPPSSSSAMPSKTASYSGSGKPGDHHQQAVELDEDLSSLIIPPPPTTSQADDVDSSLPAADNRRKFRHKRSSSVDIGALSLAKKQLEMSDKRRSLDSQEMQHQTTESSTRPSQPPRDLGDLGKFQSSLHEDVEVESPATVSLKLHNLLKSLPSFVTEDQQEKQGQEQQQQLFRTGSLRIPRSASLDVIASGRTASQSADGGTARVFSGSSVLRTFFSGTSSLGRNSGRRAAPHGQRGPEPPASTDQLVPAGAAKKDSVDKQQNHSDSLAALKAKLKDYRDSLLRRSRKKSVSLEETEGRSEKEKSGSLKRSNSLTRIMSHITRHHRSRSSDSSVYGDGNWTLRHQPPGASPSSSATDVNITSVAPAGEPDDSGGEKRAPVVREMFAVPRTITLRPKTNGGDAQTDVEAYLKDVMRQQDPASSSLL